MLTLARVGAPTGRSATSGCEADTSLSASGKASACSSPESDASCGRLSLMRIACPPGTGTLSAAATSVPPSALICCTSRARLSATIIQIESARLHNAVGVLLPNGKVILKSLLVRLAIMPCGDFSAAADCADAAVRVAAAFGASDILGRSDGLDASATICTLGRTERSTNAYGSTG